MMTKVGSNKNFQKIIKIDSKILFMLHVSLNSKAGVMAPEICENS